MAEVDFALIGNGVATLIAARRLMNAGKTVCILNPDRDFFEEDSELPLDFLNFETTNHDLERRFKNNLADEVYRTLLPEFPGALELWKGASQSRDGFAVEEAPWVRARHRLWVAKKDSPRLSQVEGMYLRALELGFKPQWLEGVSLVKHFPGFSSRKMNDRQVQDWVGFLGPRFGDVDVDRYRIGILDFLRERLSSEYLVSSAHFLEFDQRGIRYQGKSGLPVSLLVKDRILWFWTPRLETGLKKTMEKYSPQSLEMIRNQVSIHRWEEWELVSRHPVFADVVGHWGSLRIWAYGEGRPSEEGFHRVKVLRRERSQNWMGPEAFQELDEALFQFMGWERATVRKMKTLQFYRWNSMDSFSFDAQGKEVQVMTGCDGPLPWLSAQIRAQMEQMELGR